MLEQLKKLLKDEEAPTAVEYGLMLAAVAVVVMGVAFNLGDHVEEKFDNVDQELVGRTGS
jgi:Flp pilus assembly pilin Flp